MSTGLTSLAGYGSDADEEDVQSASPAVAPSGSGTGKNPEPSSSGPGPVFPPPKSALASKLPPPSASASSSKPGASGLSLPPPVTSSKRKVIKVDSLPAFQDNEDGPGLDDDGRNGSDSKKPKLSASRPDASSNRHSLFGMLPAPKRKDDEVLAERKKEAEARRAAKALEESDTPALVAAPLRISENALRSPSPEESETAGTQREVSLGASTSKPKGKNNDAFRAMLGLKPAATTPATPASSASAPTAKDIPTTQTSMQPSKLLQSSSVLSKAADAGSTAASNKAESAPFDFFSLGTTPSTRSAAASAPSSSLSISAAPTVARPDTQTDAEQAHSAGDTSQYPGWQLDPDGSWIPVTPEAHAQLLAYQQSLSSPHDTHAAPSTNAASRGAANLDGTRDLLAAGLTPDDIRSFDASSAARDAYLSRGSGADEDSDKYAAAAEFAAGNREVQQRKPGMLKGLRKGQLSSLVSLASENRSKLEERWQRGRDAQARRSNQYGF